MQGTKTDDQGRIIHDVVTYDNNPTILSNIKCEYTQDADGCSPSSDQNTIEFTTEPDQYMVIKTEIWAIDDIDEFIELLKDFKSRFTFKHEITENKQ